MKHYNGLHTKNTNSSSFFYEIKDYGIKLIGKVLGENITNSVYGHTNIKNKRIKRIKEKYTEWTTN